MENEKTFTLSSTALKLLQIIEGTNSQNERSMAIFSLSKSEDPDASRILIELWNRTMWRSTKQDILKGLGHTNNRRAVEFLLSIASASNDLSLASEAVLALSNSDDPIAGEFLLTALAEPDHPLKKEIIIALTNMDLFPCEEEFYNLLISEKSSTGLLQYIIIAVSRRVHEKSWPIIEEKIKVGIDNVPGQIFNAAMTAAGRLGNQKTIDILKNLDTRYRFFADQLKINAIERISLRLAKTVEDAVSALLASSDKDSERAALHFLKEFPTKEAWEAFSLLGGQANLDTQCLVRAVLIDKKRVDDDIEFISQNWDSINPDSIAALVRGQKRIGNPMIIETLFKEIPFKAQISIMERVRELNAPMRIIDSLKEKETVQSVSAKTSLINALVSQAIMWNQNSDRGHEIGEMIFDLLKSNDDKTVSNRILRALGQIGYDKPAFLILLGQMLKEKGCDISSIYSTLSLIKTEESAKIILRRFKAIVGNDDSEEEVGEILAALVKFGKLPDTSTLVQLTHKMTSKFRLQLLTILTANRNDHFIPLINNAIKDESYQVRMLAIAAAKLSHSKETWTLALTMLDDYNPSLAGRALDSLCVGGGMTEHRNILDWLKENIDDSGSCKKILKSMTPKEGESYQGVISRLDSLLDSGKGVFSSKENISSAIELRENILISSAFGHNQTPRSDDVSPHELDASLSSDIFHYDKYPEQIKAVLRNAELTWQHPELFNEQVDKSTIVIQFTKSIDLLMQERIGSYVFLKPDSPLLAQMQSYIILLKLDDKSIKSEQRILDLNCQRFFEPDEFPNHKLSLICSSILSGKIVNDQYRILDGLRAWSLFILVFGRNFKSNGETIIPLLPVNRQTEDQVNRVASQMNSLQEIRNRAAHRGTLLEQSQLEHVRKRSFEVLNELSNYLNF